jgi:co-chaperonin GroES (HSP10)
MKFRPLHDRVVIERIDAEAKTAGGIIIPDTAQEKPQQGKVIAVGPGGRDESGKLIPIDVKVGERILFGKWHDENGAYPQCCSAPLLAQRAVRSARNADGGAGLI